MSSRWGESRRQTTTRCCTWRDRLGDPGQRERPARPSSSAGLVGLATASAGSCRAAPTLTVAPCMDATCTFVAVGSEVSMAFSFRSFRHSRVRRLRSSAKTPTPSASAIAGGAHVRQAPASDEPFSVGVAVRTPPPDDRPLRGRTHEHALLANAVGPDDDQRAPVVAHGRQRFACGRCRTPHASPPMEPQ